MDLTYLIKGADGKDYGPVSLEQAGAWVREGRLGPEQEVRRSDMDYRARALDFAELQPFFAPPPAAAGAGPGGAPGVIRPAAGGPSLASLGAARSCATWFFLIAVLSIINTIAAFSGGAFRFIFGLGLTQLFDLVGQRVGGSGGVLALVLDLLATGVFVLLGVLARKGFSAAILTGMVLLLLDSLIFLWAKDWIGVAFHAYVLFRLFTGFQASRAGRG